MTEAPPPVPPPQTPAGGVKPHRGTAVLVLGILGLVCCVICGIIAWVMGSKDLKEMAAGTMDRSGEGLTKAGKICGIISVPLQVLWIIVGILKAMAAGSAQMQ
ncbi:MAG TPA: DUF4190 domain-containing protein [Phycisphaerae bacterium]|nr:DUF4190 domain-containing protein [Phycisphaerae bacterium]